MFIVEIWNEYIFLNNTVVFVRVFVNVFNLYVSDLPTHLLALRERLAKISKIASQKGKRLQWLRRIKLLFFSVLLVIVMDIRPNHTVYINNINDKVKKEGEH